jgi:acarbose 7IV-phosphotransferase
VSKLVDPKIFNLPKNTIIDINRELDMKRLGILGCASVDSIIYMENFPQPIPQTLIADRFHETVGSTGSGKALNLSKLGFEIDFHALIGDDYYGHKIIDFLSAQNRLNFLYNFDEKATQRHCNIMNQAGQRISIFAQESSYNLVGSLDEVEDIIKNSDSVILNIGAYCKDYIPLIKKHNKEIWCDLHDYDGKNPYHQEFIESADYLFMSSDNCPEYKEVMNRLLKYSKKFLVCTHGKDGATLLTANGEFMDFSIIDKYEMIDTNGAGDSFMSGFMFGYLKGYSLEESMKLATVSGGLCINSKELVNSKLSEKLLIDEYKQYFTL